MELQELKKQFRKAVDGQDTWAKEAKTDFEFKLGQQWESADVKALKDSNRPAITVNMCRPMVNMLTGYFTQNPYEPQFIPKSGGKDVQGVKIVEGVTKYVYDLTDFPNVKNKVFEDKCTCGKGWKFYGVDWDYEKIDPRIVIERVSPFSVYVDPECKNEDLSDAEYLCRAKWVTKEKLKTVYPEKAIEIESQVTQYATEENNTEHIAWYNADGMKLRVVEHWYKEHYLRTLYKIPPGMQQMMGLPPIIKDATATAKKILDKMGKQFGVQQVKLPAYKMKLAVYTGEVELEEMDSPYKHNLFPYVIDVAYFTGEGDDAAAEPHGIIRDLRDVQRELNKAESQQLDILNKQPNTGWFIPENSMQEEELKSLKRNGAKPGGVWKFNAQIGKPEQIQPPAFNSAIITMAQECKAAFRSISGINEELLGTDTPASASGKAIMLRKQAAQTQIAVLFEQSRLAEHRGLKLLWGTKENPGLIPQYFTDSKVIRILDEDGQQQFVQIAPTGKGDIQNPDGTLQFDLSQFEFDIKISDKPTTATVRMQRLYELIDASKFVQFPPIVFLDAMDLPNKEKYVQIMNQQAPPPAPQVTSNISVDLATLPPELQQQVMAMIMSGQKISAKISEQGPAGMNPQAIAAMQQAVPNQFSRGDMAAMGG